MPILPRETRHAGDSTSTSFWQRDVTDLFSSKKSLPTKDLVVFCRKLSFLLNAGLTVKSALVILAGQAEGISSAISDVHKQVMQGHSFSHAVSTAGVFPPFMCGYIAIGEATGQLPKVCNQLAGYYERHAQTKQEIKAAMMYPALVTTMMFSVVVFATVFVLPGYTQIFAASDVPLPFITTALLGVSSFLTRHGIFIFAGLLAAVGMLILFLRNNKGRGIWDNMKLKMPLHKQGINLHFVQALSLMLSAGINISPAISLCEDIIQNTRVKKDLSQLSVNLNTGEPFWVSLAQIPYIDPLLTDLARVGEETGHLAQTIEKCHHYFDTNYRQTIRRLNKLIEPIITIIMGILLAIIMLAIVLPTFELATAM